MIEVKVKGVFMTQAQASGVILKEIKGNRTLPIIIGEYEAQSIALGLENIKPPRPITHDLTLNLIEAASCTLESIIISELKENTYYAIIRLQSSLETFEVDARPSDAIALAVRTGSSIFVEEEVMAEAGFIPEGDEESPLGADLGNEDDPIDKIEKELKQAVENEDYEKAAILRDLLKQRRSAS